MEQTTIEKFSDTEIKEIIDTPEQVIPASRVEKVTPLKDIEKELEEVNSKIAQKEASKNDTIKERAKFESALKQDEDAIAVLVETKTKLEAKISEAKEKGVKSEIKPVEEVPVDVIDLQARVEE